LNQHALRRRDLGASGCVDKGYSWLESVTFGTQLFSKTHVGINNEPEGFGGPAILIAEGVEREEDFTGCFACF
jgi:hypothetical protein